jgi:putative transposon-encoded protein
MNDIINKFREGELSQEEFVEEINKKVIEERDAFLTYKDIASVEQAFKVIFKKSVHVLTKLVRSGGTSAKVYVPKDFEGYPVTIIIWDKEKFDDGTSD